METRTPLRRHVLFTMAATVLTTVSATAPIGAKSDFGEQTVTVTEGTNIAATVSPDDGTIVMDLQG